MSFFQGDVTSFITLVNLIGVLSIVALFFFFSKRLSQEEHLAECRLLELEVKLIRELQGHSGLYRSISPSFPEIRKLLILQYTVDKEASIEIDFIKNNDIHYFAVILKSKDKEVLLGSCKVFVGNYSAKHGSFGNTPALIVKHKNKSYSSLTQFYKSCLVELKEHINSLGEYNGR